MSGVDRRAVRPGSVPGWVIDAVTGEAGGCVLTAARAASTATSAAPARYATIALAAADDADAHETLARLAAQAGTGTEVLDTALGAHRVIAMVLPAELGAAAVASAPPAGVSTRPDLVAASTPVDRPSPPPPPADRPSPRTRRPAPARIALAPLAALLLVVAFTWAGDRPQAASADGQAEVEWDATTATATVRTAEETRRFVLGEPGDQLVIGDWDGDGRPSPALYRPATGDVWVFDAWADGAAPTAARWSARHASGGRAVVVATPDGDEIAVRRP